MVNVHRVVPDPRHPLAALADLAERPEDLEELLALRALTDPLAVDALNNISLVPPEDRYFGPRASVVMAPFLIVGQSRFSPGTFGVLYTADEFIVAVRESSYHAGRYLRAAGIVDPVAVPRYELQLTLDDSRHIDIRKGGADDVHQADIYDPNSYAISQSFGAKIRASGRPGIWYDSVRSSGGTCYATFKPVAIRNVKETARELELMWDGRAITEYRELQTHRL
jgi:hypothetical protein